MDKDTINTKIKASKDPEDQTKMPNRFTPSRNEGSGQLQSSAGVPFTVYGR